MSHCYVTDADYQRHWLGRSYATDPPLFAPPPPYDGPNRRRGPDRRGDRDRRWDTARGRRYRLRDRRRHA